jgi:hypothetical protein
MLPRFIPLLGLLVLLVVAGCSPEAGGGGPEWLRSRPEPVKLDLTLDRGRAVTKTITPRGGTLTATGADGTRYRLRIPPDALLSDARITLIPIVGVRGLPLAGGSVAAVQLEPDGLRLMQPATLSVRTEQEVPVAERVAFGYYGAGEDAHRYPLEPDPKKIEMKLLHFSGYGFGRAAPDDPGRLALQRATAYEARLQSRIAEAVDRDRQQDGGLSAETVALIQQSLIEYYDAVIRPLMRTAETDDRIAACCISRYLGWERQVLLLGLDGDERDPAPAPDSPEGQLRQRRTEAQASYLAILRSAYDKGIERAARQCREEHDFAAITTLLGLSRQAQLAGVATEGGEQRVFDEIRNCMSFEVEFRSVFDNRGPANTQLYYHVAARVPVQVELFPSGDWDIGTAPLEYVRFDARGNPKEALFGEDTGSDRDALWESISSATVSPRGTRPGTFIVRSVEWDWNTIDSPATDCEGRDATESKQQPTNFAVVFSPGAPTEITHVVPTRDLWGAGPHDQDDTMWAIHWANAHRAEQLSVPDLDDPDDELDGVYRVVLDDATEAGMWRRSFQRPDPGDRGWSLSEDGVLILRHAPR